LGLTLSYCLNLTFFTYKLGSTLSYLLTSLFPYARRWLNTILPANYPISVRTTVAQHYLTCVCNVILLLNGLTLILTLSCGLWVSVRVTGVPIPAISAGYEPLCGLRASLRVTGLSAGYGRLCARRASIRVAGIALCGLRTSLRATSFYTRGWHRSLQTTVADLPVPQL
jgi:hypothetical protein